MIAMNRIPLNEITPSYVSEVLQAIRNDYNISRPSRYNRRRSGLSHRGSSGDYHIRNESDFYKNIEYARDMDRNDAIIGQMVSRAVDNEVQGGFTLEFNTGDKKLDRDLKQRFWAECNDPEEFDIAGEHNFNDLEWYASRSAKVDGDCGILGDTEQNKVQFFEAHSIYKDGANGNFDGTDGTAVINGVENDLYRRRIAYYISRDRLNPWDTTREDAERIPTRDSSGIRQFFHIYNSPRLTMSRGITALAPIFPSATMLEDINQAKLIQQQVASFFAILETSGHSHHNLPSVGPFNSESTNGTFGPINEDQPEGPGIRYRVPAGTELNAFSPNIPNSEYFEQVNLIIRIISVNLGLPLMMALLDGSDSTFHGYRGALDEARRGFKRNQMHLIKRFHTPFTVWKINRWLEDDVQLLAAASLSTINITNFEWSPPGFPYVEPTADANGDVLQLRNNLNSPRRIQKARGRDHEVVTTETIEDNTFAIQAAVKAANRINASVTNQQDKVHWRDLISMPTPEGVNVTQAIQNVETSEASE